MHNAAASTANSWLKYDPISMRAAGDSETDAGQITEGDYLGICRDGIVVIADTLDAAVCGLIEKLATDDHGSVRLGRRE